MKRENALNTIGLCLLAACFLFALFRVFGRETHDKRDGRVVIRFAHWQLEGGLRDAFDQLARKYEQLHPGVRVEQLAIPERTYSQWVKTQLIGGTAPDILQLNRDRGIDIEVAARFLHPITAQTRQPNPYNAGTPLAGMPWRDTIVDGMTTSPSYESELLENYGAAVSLFTIRMYYNRELWRQILGDTPPPRTYEEFQALFPRIAEYNARTGRKILPIAGSKVNAPMLINVLLQNQTQRLVQEKIAGPTLRTSGAEIGVRLLRGDWTLDDPAFTDAMSIAREIALGMQPGFNQLGREDATFYFVQGNALMITTGSWDSPSFRAQVDFDLGVFNTPLPVPSASRYGRNTLGPSSEVETAAGLVFGVTRLTSNFEQSLDFIRFLSSQPYNAEFSRLSGWLPSVVDVDPPDAIKPFLPRADGYVPGFEITFSGVGANTTRVTNTSSSLLYSANGSVDAFRAAIAADLPKAIEDDIRRNLKLSEMNSARQDVALLAYLALQRHHPENPDYVGKIDQLLDAQHGIEATGAWLTGELDQLKNTRR